MQRWIASTKCIIGELPEANYVLLRELCYFLNEVAQFADVNAMGGTNLATCFGPNLLTTKESASLEELLDLTPLVTRFILKCLEHADELFADRQLPQKETNLAMDHTAEDEPITADNTDVMADQASEDSRSA